MSRPLRLLVEATPKKVYVSALDWPGLARWGRTEEEAIESLLAAFPRYGRVAHRAGERFDPTDWDLEVVERVGGDASTAFGVPSIVVAADREPLDDRDAKRLAALVEAAWVAFDAAAAGAPASLRKGPRGGGRDTAKVVEHVHRADQAYATVIGVKGRVGTAEEVEAMRGQVLATLRTASDGAPLAGRKWPTRYAARRIAWHALDHAWEIEDRSAPA